jgi:type II secretion system protein G
VNDTTIETPVATGGKDKGFTLVELLIVIVILGILATVTVFAVRGITDNAQDNACDTDAKTISTALEAYYADNGIYPTTVQGLAVLSSGTTKYLKTVPATFTYSAAGDDFTLVGTGKCSPPSTTTA